MTEVKPTSQGLSQTIRAGQWYHRGLLREKQRDQREEEKEEDNGNSEEIVSHRLVHVGTIWGDCGNCRRWGPSGGGELLETALSYCPAPFQPEFHICFLVSH